VGNAAAMPGSARRGDHHETRRTRGTGGSVSYSAVLKTFVVLACISASNATTALIDVRLAPGAGNGQTRAVSELLEPPSSVLPVKNRPEIARASIVLPRPVSRAACPNESAAGIQGRRQKAGRLP